jgi:hypothetical protein
MGMQQADRGPYPHPATASNLTRGAIVEIEQTPWPESVNELYQPSDRRLSEKLVINFADRGCCVVSVTDLYGRILGFLDRSRYYFFLAADQLYSRG